MKARFSWLLLLCVAAVAAAEPFVRNDGGVLVQHRPVFVAQQGNLDNDGTETDVGECITMDRNRMPSGACNGGTRGTVATHAWELIAFEMWTFAETFTGNFACDISIWEWEDGIPAVQVAGTIIAGGTELDEGVGGLPCCNNAKRTLAAGDFSHTFVQGSQVQIRLADPADPNGCPAGSFCACEDADIHLGWRILVR